MDGDEPRGRLDRHRVRDLSAHVAALRDVSRVSEAPHQLDPSARHAGVIPAGRLRLAREPEPGIDGITTSKASSARPRTRGIGERADELDLLEDRTGPPVRDDDRQRVIVLGSDVDEVHVVPSISLVYWGRALSFASHLRQS